MSGMLIMFIEYCNDNSKDNDYGVLNITIYYV